MPRVRRNIFFANSKRTGDAGRVLHSLAGRAIPLFATSPLLGTEISVQSLAAQITSFLLKMSHQKRDLRPSCCPPLLYSIKWCCRLGKRGRSLRKRLLPGQEKPGEALESFKRSCLFAVEWKRKTTVQLKPIHIIALCLFIQACGNSQSNQSNRLVFFHREKHGRL